VADRQLLGWDHAFGLVADVEEDLVAIDLHDDAFHDVAVFEVAERRLHRADELLGRVVLALRLERGDEGCVLGGRFRGGGRRVGLGGR
jgi:hypothetical protein